MPALKHSVFGGIRPVENRRLLSDSEAQVANNCDLDAGSLRCAREATDVYTLPDANQRSIYLAGGVWLSWTGDVDVVKSPVSLDVHERIYWTGDGIPKVRGLVNGVPTTYDLGVPKPIKAPVVAVQQLTSTSWTRRWHSFYEEPNGDQVDPRDHTEGTDIASVIAGYQYVMAGIPAKVTASAVAKFILWFEAYRTTAQGTQAYIGVLYPHWSDAAANSDVYIQGAKLTARQANVSGVATFYITYTSDKTTNYTVDRSYVYTFVSIFGEEGPPSPPSSDIPVDPTQECILSNMDTGVSGNRNITAKRIYRTVTGDAGTDFQFIAEIPLYYTQYGDIILDEDAGEVLESTTWYPPPEGLTGLRAMPGGFLIGFTDRTVHMSEVNFPHAWPSGFDTVVKADIVAVEVSDSNIFVTTTGLPEIITAPDPQNISVYQIPSPQPCASKRSIIQWGGAIFYASFNGIVNAQGTATVLVTDSYIDEATWRSWHPETMIFCVYKNRLLVFSDNQALRITMGLDSMIIVTRDERVTGVFSDTANDVLYVIVGNKIKTWDTGANKQLTWRGKEYVFDKPIEFGCSRDTCSAYPVSKKLYADGLQSVNVIVDSNAKRRLPKVRAEKFWALEIVALDEVSEIAAATSMDEL